MGTVSSYGKQEHMTASGEFDTVHSLFDSVASNFSH